MKKVLLLNDGRFLWQTIRVYLGGINASVRSLDADVPEREIADWNPDLLLLGVDRYRARGVPSRPRNVMVVDDDGSFAESPNKLRRGTIRIEWPAERERFLEQTAALLGVPPRKLFQTVVRIFVRGAEYAAVGQSSDFSMAGMSFVAEKFFAHGQKISISVTFPAEKWNVILDGRVARSSVKEEAGHTLYGVEFGSLDKRTEEALKTFVLA